MSDDITVRENGRAEAMYALKPAWHGLGTVLDHAPNSEEAMKAAGLLWEVIQAPVQTLITEEQLTADGSPEIVNDIVEIPNVVANVRSDNHRPLGVVTTCYKPVQNTEAFAFLDGLVEDGSIRYESAGSLRGGRTVWLLARMPGDLEVAEGDASARYILLTNTHDGTRAVRFLPTAVRVVCQNTLSLALRSAREGQVLRIAHMGNVANKLAAARAMLQACEVRFAAYLENARKMAAVKVTPAQQEQLIEELLPDQEDRDNRYREKARDRMLDLLNAAPQQLPSIAGTAWATYNAISQYVDHDARRLGKTAEQKAENRMISAFMGIGARMKAAAFESSLAMAGV